PCRLCRVLGSVRCMVRRKGRRACSIHFSPLWGTAMSQGRSTMRRRAYLLASAAVATLAGHAWATDQWEWTDAAGDRLWSNGSNWVDLSNPSGTSPSLGSAIIPGGVPSPIVTGTNNGAVGAFVVGGQIDFATGGL